MIDYTPGFRELMALAGEKTLLQYGNDVMSEFMGSKSKSGIGSIEYGMGNDFLTELRLYLYLRFFAGIGFDYSVVAAKIGVFGQVDLDMAFQWLNGQQRYDHERGRQINQGTYNLNGQNFKIKGTAGLEVVLKLLFISYEKILYSKSWNLLDESTGQSNKIQTNRDLNSAANRAAISDMMRNGSLDVYSVGGQQMVSLNLAPALEDRSYPENGGRSWGPGFMLFSLDPEDEQGLKNLESNTYPCANPVVTDDGALVACLHDRVGTKAPFAPKTLVYPK